MQRKLIGWICAALAALCCAGCASTEVAMAGRTDGGPGLDKSGDTELQAMVADVLPRFTQETWHDAESGLDVTYNLYVPEDYQEGEHLPLVVFIADASTIGSDATRPLWQGWGGLVWATDAEQAKHRAIVLVPSYPVVILDDHGSYTTTPYVELTARLIEAVKERWQVSKTYGTGQSMGCMTTLILASEYPDLYDAELFVSGQWEADALGGLAHETFFYVVSEGDERASEGQAAVVAMLDAAGVSYSESAGWDARADNTALVEAQVAEGERRNFATLRKGTTLAAGADGSGGEHLTSFDYVYRIEALRDWLFRQ